MMHRRALAVMAALLMAGCGKADSPAPAGTPPPTPASNPGAKAPDAEPSKGVPKQVSAELLAKELLDDAVRREKSDRPDLAQAAYHDVCVRHPFTKAGRQAAARCVELESDLQKSIDREFDKARQEAETLSKAGKHGDAVAGLKKFSETASTDPLKRRAAALAVTLENVARQAYGTATKAAKTAAVAGSLDEAARLIKAASQNSIPAVQETAEGDLQLLDRYRQAQETKKSVAVEETAQKAFGERAQRLHKRLKERAYAEVIKELDAAIADPALAPCRELLTADRAAVASAATFWEALQKGLKSRLNQEVALLTAEGKSIRGTLKKIHESGTSIRLEGQPADIQLDSVHSDSLLLLAIGRDGLSDEASTSYAAASMWFFLEGRQEISRIELATALGLGADVSVLETAWRRGFFRAVIAK